jgi:hypothetical protein
MILQMIDYVCHMHRGIPNTIRETIHRVQFATRPYVLVRISEMQAQALYLYDTGARLSEE